MPILSLRILPPFAIGRFGSSPTPLEAYDLIATPDAPLDYRRISPCETLEVDPGTGGVVRRYTPERIIFRDGAHIRPVAPFLEVFAQTGPDELEPLTAALLAEEGLGPPDVHWSVKVANLKIFRQTGDPNDKVLATLTDIVDHDLKELRGRAEHFLEDKHIPFGHVRYIRPTEDFPEIRFRFTPPAGRVYGTSRHRFNLDMQTDVPDPTFADDSRIVYDAARGTWLGFQADVNSMTLPNPSDIYQGYWPDPSKLPVGWGYLDDVCDGRVSVRITKKGGEILGTSAWISSCMPAFAPDSQPVRTVADEIEQLILGPDVSEEEVSIEAAAEIVRRALETIRLMNTAAMNANVIQGRSNIGSTLFRQDTNDYGRRWEPGMASSIVDNLAVRRLHERVYAALLSGSAPWFADALRKPEEVGDLSDKARRKMPPMLRGADGRALTLTRRQISKIVRAAVSGLFENDESSKSGARL